MGADPVKRALTGAILIHGACVLIAAETIASGLRGLSLYTGVAVGFLGFIALIAAAIKKDIDPKV